MRQGGVNLVIDINILFELLDVGLFLGGVELAECVVFGGAETPHHGHNFTGEH